MAFYYQYRDSVTGRYTKASTYNRSHAQGGKRYSSAKREVEKKEPEEVTPTTVEEWEKLFEEAETEDYDFVSEEAESGGDY